MAVTFECPRLTGGEQLLVIGNRGNRPQKPSAQALRVADRDNTSHQLAVLGDLDLITLRHVIKN